MKIYLLVLLCVLCAIPAAAQTPATTNAKVMWDIDESRAFELDYKLYIDGVPTVLSGKTCGPNIPLGLIACQAPLPAMTIGTHTLELSALDISDPANPVESAKSSSVIIRFYLAPNVPTNVRVTK